MNHPQVPPHDSHFMQYSSGEWCYSMHPPSVGHIALSSAREHRRMIACVARCDWLDEAASRLHTCTNHSVEEVERPDNCRACEALKVADAWRAWESE